MNAVSRKFRKVRALQGPHGVEGGKPPVFPPCTAHKPYKTSDGKIKVRHRFQDRVCKCGVIDAPGLYRFEEIDGVRVWYVKDGKDWNKLPK
jgi:hypothetical protein